MKIKNVLVQGLLIAAAISASSIQAQAAGSTCAPLDGEIRFIGEEAYRDEAVLKGGDIPFNQAPLGSMRIVGPAFEFAPTERSPVLALISQGFYFRSGADASLLIQEAPRPKLTPDYLNDPRIVNVQGVIRLNYLVIQDIQASFVDENQIVENHSNPHMFWSRKQNICVSGIAVNLKRLQPAFFGVTGQVYLYLNGTNRGYVLHF